MDTKITKNIKVSVETFYQPGYSKPPESKYIFAYRVTIENLGSDTVQLLKRHWIIKDANGLTQHVEGDGVIGKQPVLSPKEKHQYMSWCPLSTPLGKMFGSFEMIRHTDQHKFKVQIPEFQLFTPFKMN